MGEHYTIFLSEDQPCHKKLCYNLSMSMFLQLKTYCIKIWTWGLPGVVQYAKTWFRRRKLQKSLLADAKRQPFPIPERGITLVGKFTQSASHGKVVRDLARKLKLAGIPYQTLNTDEAPNVPESDVVDILTPLDSFHIKRFTHVVEILPSIIPAKLRLNLSRIAFWEFESGFLHAYPDMPLSKNVIAMSDFNAAYFKSILPSHVHVTKIDYPFHAQATNLDDSCSIRTRYGISPAEFVVFFNFDFGSSYYRKNPEGAMRAFAKAFQDTPGTRLVFKTMRAKTRPDLLAKTEALAKELGITEKLTMIHTYIPERDIFGLTNACDVYLSLHRGEGFGITLAEAMAMGKPVVCTNWSSTTEFCKPECSIPIPFKMVPVRPEQIDHPYYQKVKEWAEPDVDAAAAALKRLYENPELRNDLGRKAAASIKEQFSIANFKKSVEAFLNQN